MRKSVILLVESGRALEMVKEHIAERLRVCKMNSEIADELNVTEFYSSNLTGVFTGPIFDGDIHPDFKKPNRRNGVSYPKKGTEWEKRINELVGWRDPSDWISTELSIPRQVSYTTLSGGHGWTIAGIPLRECGFLHLSADGPYAIWAPDIPAIVAEMSTEDQQIEEPAKSFKFAIEGTRRIDQEEWDYLTAKHRFDAKQVKAA